jgi:hypothetical protein
VQMFYTDPRQTGHFSIRKDLLTRLDSYQGRLSAFRRYLLPCLMFRAG